MKCDRRRFLEMLGVGGASLAILPPVSGRPRRDDPPGPPGDGILWERPIGVQGRVHLRLVEPGTGRVVREGYHENLITDTGLGFLADVLMNVTSTGLRRLALGTDDTAAAAGDTTLVAEHCRGAQFRKTQFWDEDNEVGESNFSYFFAAATADCNIRELGIFASATATDTTDSGVLFSRVVVAEYYDNSDGEYDVLVDWRFRIGRAA